MTTIKEKAGCHANITVGICEMGGIELKNILGGTTPNQMIGESVHSKIIDRQEFLRIDSSACGHAIRH